jgi:hypothetical protein
LLLNNDEIGVEPAFDETIILFDDIGEDVV